MGDYSQGHFRFALKKDTPKEIKEKLQGLIRGESFDIGTSQIYLGDSAYHRMPTFAESRYAEWSDDHDRKYCLTFQIKYGCGQLQAFAEWLAPHVVVNKQNKGVFGYSISEYADVPTVFLIVTKEDDSGAPKK